MNGGIYLDIKLQCINDFKLIYLTDKEYFIQDNPEYFQNGVGIFNALLCVLPKESNFLLPKPLRKLMLNVKSSLAHLYPSKYKIDLIPTEMYSSSYPTYKTNGEKLNVYISDKPLNLDEYKLISYKWARLNSICFGL